MAARAQGATRRLGFLCLSFPTEVFGKSLSGAFLEELGARGWNEGVNLHIDWRWYGADLALAEHQAAELVALNCAALAMDLGCTVDVAGSQVIGGRSERRK
jgi:putative ABC transport system substrate-binding protein